MNNNTNNENNNIMFGTWWISEEGECQPYCGEIYRAGPHNEREIKLWWEDKEVFTVEKAWGVLKKGGNWELKHSLSECLAEWM